MKIKNIILALTVAVLGSACSDWFDVSPKTDIKSDEFFSDENGFQSALTGCYVRMTNDETYGKNLSWYFVEKLAQRYDDQIQYIGGITANVYDYTSDYYSKDEVNEIWLEMYKTIANINNLLFHLDNGGKDIIKTPGYWELMKGEALALRAFHHFDLLRLYGPIYKENSSVKCMPYKTSFANEQAPLLTATEILNNIIADLTEAEICLENDPLNWGKDVDEPFVSYRGHRMNKYAVKALLARVYLYRGSSNDYVTAGRLAKEIIADCGLNLVTDNTKDVAMFDETLFGLHVHDMEERFDDYFTTGDARNGQELWINRDHGQELYEFQTVGINDIRVRSGYGFYYHNTHGMMTRKYLPSSDNNYSEKLPLIRLGEIYLIAAEATGDVTYLNRLRNVRGISRVYNLDEVTTEALQDEYAKEFFAEGQLFYFYKRHALKDFYRCPSSLVGSMSASQYVLPLPDGEVEFGWVDPEQVENGELN